MIFKDYKRWERKVREEGLEHTFNNSPVTGSIDHVFHSGILVLLMGEKVSERNIVGQ